MGGPPIHTVFGLMMSHSHLCELIHGMMRHGLRTGKGMDQVDAQQAHMIFTEYDQQKLLLSPDDEQNAKQIKSIEHSKTKGQVDMMGVRQVDAVEEFEPNWDMESRLFDWSTRLAGGTRTRGTWLARWKQKIRRLRKTHRGS
jgi:hypothetical protein